VVAPVGKLQGTRMTNHTTDKQTTILISAVHRITVQQEWPYLDWVVRESRRWVDNTIHGRFPLRHQAEAVAHAIAIVREAPLTGE
jgi:hypothetical protein